jgi:hypothetical protein
MAKASRCIIGGIKVTGNPKNAIAGRMFRVAIAKELDRKGILPLQYIWLCQLECNGICLGPPQPVFLHMHHEACHWQMRSGQENAAMEALGNGCMPLLQNR